MKNIKLSCLYSILALMMFSASAPSSAQTDGIAAPASPLSKLYECKAIAAPTERLACYDSAVAIVETREAKKEIVTIDSTTATKLKREAFGFSLPSLPKLGLPASKDAKDTDDLEFAVKTVSQSRRAITITMENGQIWKGVSGRLNYIPRGDLTARISRGALGSYRLSLSNGKERVRGLGVRRVE